MLKLFIFACILAFAAASPAPAPKPGFVGPIAYTAPIAYTSALRYPYASYAYAPGYYGSYVAPYSYYRSAYLW